MRTLAAALGVSVVVPVVLAAQPASAVNFVYDSQSIGGNTYVGVHESITTTFNPDSELLTWSSTFSTNPKNGKLADGAWLVLSDGPNPKSHEQAYAMFYLDGVNENLTAYTYNGVNGSNSWKDSNSVFLGSWDLDVEDNAAGDERTMAFSLDMTAINSRTDLGDKWEGTHFDDKVGIWFHGVENVNAAYNADGSLKQFDYASQGWYDTANRDTEAIPEPSAALAMGVVAAAGLVRRKQLTAAKKSSQ